MQYYCKYCTSVFPRPVWCFTFVSSSSSLGPGTLQQLISDTMVRWAQESVIEDPELVRAMFVLLHRQYDGIGGQVGVYVCVPQNLSL